MSTLPRVALIGRPNVGKSTLYNRLIGKRQAVVAKVAGTTRDRLEGLVQWEGRQFILIDMAGLEPSLSEDTEISRGTQAQVFRALSDAEAIVWVVDLRAGVTLADQQIGEMLHKLNKNVLIAANKSDHVKHDIDQYEFSRFGFETIVPVSALNGRGISDLLDAVKAEFSTAEAVEVEDPKELKIAIIGRPNVGKSTLLNALTDDERSVVSSVPGTTRDSVDTLIPATQLFKRTFTKWEQVRIIDTAGIRRRGKIEMGIESWSFLRTINAVEEAEITLLMLDGTEGLTQQDLHIAQRILEIGRPVIILVNKWDAVLSAKGIIPGTVEDEKQQETFLDMLRKEASFLFWAQVLFLSAQEKINLHIVSRLVLNAYNAWNLEVSQKDLDELVEKLKFQPLFKSLQKITLQHNKPPVFHLHVEGKNLPHFSTHRAAENVLREVFDIGPTPIKIWTETSIQKRSRFN